MDPVGAEFPRVTAVVVNWNTGQLCVKQLESLSSALGRGLRLVIVDNGSVDDSLEVLNGSLAGTEFGSSVDIVRSPANLGFCEGVNLGTSKALSEEPPPDYVWMLNPDAEVSPATALELVAVMKESGAGIATPAARSGLHIGERAWPRVFWAPQRFWLGPAPAGARWWRGGRYGGACVMFSTSLVREMIESSGYFQDPSLFMDGDEWDGTLRAAALGQWVALAPQADLAHGQALRTLGKAPVAAMRQYYQSRNMIVVARGNLPGWKFWPLLGLRFGRDLTWFVRLRVIGDTPNERAYIQGAWDGLRGRSGIWKHHPPSPAAKR